MLIVFLLALTAGVLLGSQSRPEAAVRILFTGEVQGTFEPCGCAGGPTGGLARRAGYAAEVAEYWKGPLLQIDAGNYFENPGPTAEAVNRLLSESLERLPITAMNLGSDDLYWWPKLAEVESARSRIVSTNLGPRRSGLPVPNRVITAEVAVPGVPDGKVRLDFLGVVDPFLVKPNSGFRARDPVEAVRAAMQDLDKADFVVLFWEMIRPSQQFPPGSPVVKLAESVEGIDLIITTEKRFVRYDPVRIGSTTILSSIERGRFLGDLQVFFESSGAVKEIRTDFEELKEGVREDSVFRAEQDGVAAAIR